METFQEFCQLYELDPSTQDAKEQYKGYSELLGIVETKKNESVVNKGGRPHKSDSERKDKQITVRLTLSDYEDIKKLSERAGFKNVTHFIRSNINAWTRDQLTK